MESLNLELWKICEELRNKNERSTIPAIIRELQKKGIEINDDCIDSILRTQTHKYSFQESTFPNYVKEFIFELLKDKKPLSILDPCAGYGIDIFRLVKKLGSENSVGIVNNDDAYKTAHLIDENSRINWRLGEPLSTLDRLGEKYDAIVSSLPYGRTSRITLS